MENLTKSRISYLHFYELYLDSFRNREINLLEVGVRSGASLRMWKEYFAKAQIYGLDISPDCVQHAEDRIAIMIGDQSDPIALDSVCSKVSGFDIIIDDGCHLISHIQFTFKYLFKKLNQNGVYIIEDLNNTYGRWGNRRQDIVPFFESLVNTVDANSESEAPILTVHFWPNVCIIVKS